LTGNGDGGVVTVSGHVGGWESQNMNIRETARNKLLMNTH
jgi:hypothetical protein